jgi:hypothetical protein
MTGKGRYNLGENTDLIAKLADMENRLSRLERAPQLGTTSIDSGTLVVKDNTGTTRVEVGLLEDGSYGLEVREQGQTDLHQVPFVYTQSIITGEVCSSSTYGDLTTPGPAVTVPVRSSGRILILATAQIQVTTAFAASVTADGRFNVEFSGANTRTPNEVVDPLVGIADNNTIVTSGTIAFFSAISGTSQAVFEGLNPGNTTITMKYRRSTLATADPTFFRRALTVFAL